MDRRSPSITQHVHDASQAPPTGAGGRVHSPPSSGGGDAHARDADPRARTCESRSARCQTLPSCAAAAKALLSLSTAAAATAAGMRKGSASPTCAPGRHARARARAAGGGGWKGRVTRGVSLGAECARKRRPVCDAELWHAQWHTNGADTRPGGVRAGQEAGEERTADSATIRKCVASAAELRAFAYLAADVAEAQRLGEGEKRDHRRARGGRGCRARAAAETEPWRCGSLRGARSAACGTALKFFRRNDTKYKSD